MGVWRSLAGTVRIKITSADVPAALRLLTDRNILLQDITYETDLCVAVTVRRRDHKRLKQLLSARGDSCEYVSRWGLYWALEQIVHRPVFILGLTILLALTIYVPSRVFFVQVTGNTAVSSRLILEQTQKIGLTFGCDRKSIQSEQMKNALLEMIPELDWVGITTAGCVATVEVREKLTEEKKQEVQHTVSSLIASCDGVVESITVTSGTALCHPGQAVRRGQVLISGYEDHGLVIKAANAQGEIYARTYRYLQSVTPTESAVRTASQEVQTKFSLQIGKKLINFFKDSGISPTGCVKMYSKKYLTLPGGFELPLALVTETLYFCDLEPQCNTEDDFFWAEKLMDQYVRTQMLAGEVLQKKVSAELLDDIYVLSLEYACREQIGQIRVEENLNHNGENS